MKIKIANWDEVKEILEEELELRINDIRVKHSLPLNKSFKDSNHYFNYESQERYSFSNIESVDWNEFVKEIEATEFITDEEIEEEIIFHLMNYFGEQFFEDLSENIEINSEETADYSYWESQFPKMTKEKAKKIYDILKDKRDEELVFLKEKTKT